MAKYTPVKKWRDWFTTFAPLILWIGVVAFLSSSNASMAATSRFIGPLVKFFLPNAPDETLRSIHVVIRKLAHFTEYSLLAFFAVGAIARSSYNFRGYLQYLQPFILVAIVASVDEINQSFDTARTGLASDALLDIASGGVMIGVLWLLKWPRPLARSDGDGDA